MKDMLIKMREQLNKKVEEAFAKFMETAADDDRAAEQDQRADCRY
jgi:hypothetical protein